MLREFFAMEEAVPSSVVLYVVEALARANFLAFLLVARMDNAIPCL